jgi:hypothetical protein
LFAALHRWFEQADFEGCPLIGCLLETHDPSSPSRATAKAAIDHVYELLRRLADEAGAHDPERLAHQLQILMRGAIVAAVEGNADAVAHARSLERLLIEREARG